MHMYPGPPNPSVAQPHDLQKNLPQGCNNGRSGLQPAHTHMSTSPSHEHNPLTPSSVPQTPCDPKDLSNNYVYRILMRSHKGEIELAKQKYLEDKMKERQAMYNSRTQGTANDTVNESDVRDDGSHVDDDEGDDDFNNDSEESGEEDDSDSELDEYEVVFIDKLNRTRICDLVMDYEVDHHSFLPTIDRYNFLGDSLVGVFIHEDKAAWIGVSEDEVVKGRFPDRVKKLRPESIEWGFWKSPHARTAKSKGTVVISLECLKYFLDETDRDAEFLKKWEEFRQQRIEFFESASIAAIASDIPAIVAEGGHELLLSDFNSSHATHENFKERWPKLPRVLVKVSKIRKWR
ncbi:hypothetical protein QAD02_013262 [Eretmocerus hayati]|uniref:Uncharacterized protein n=1 Tax=Eretmocerus hayati TaxID=131215 RepID=A0ACC2P6R2_9HYME|nr:hypothetical protein QAD02_013262 [Eretmocerus hayati]